MVVDDWSSLDSVGQPYVGWLWKQQHEDEQKEKNDLVLLLIPFRYFVSAKRQLRHLHGVEEQHRGSSRSIRACVPSHDDIVLVV